MNLMAAMRDQRGSALIETAITVPLFVAFVLGVTNFVDLARSHQAAGIAAREAVRYAATYEGDRSLGSAYDSLVAARAISVAGAHGLDAGRGSVSSVTATVSSEGRGDSITVVVRATVSLLGFEDVTITRSAMESGAAHASLGAPP